jgi:hypothetical protein
MSKKPIDPRIERLPGKLKPMAEICGFEGVMRLLEHFAGQEVYVPSVSGSHRSKIAKLCGPGVARAFAQVMESTRSVRVPLAEGLRTEAKHKAIMRDRRTANAIAAELNMHVDSVHRIRAGRGAKHKVQGADRRRDDRQSELFSLPK